MHLSQFSHSQVRRQISSSSPSGLPGDPSGGQQDNSSSQPGGGNIVFIIIGLVALFLLTLTIGTYAFLRHLRTQNRKPTYIPTSFLKQRWNEWSPRKGYARRPSDRSGNASTINLEGESLPMAATEAAADAGVDRHTSVRSIMTLPAYSQTPKETEQVIGREGERAGMDTVVEFPETAQEIEARREDEMESLYQIRQARRQENAEREQRRQERREARARGDWARLDELARESRARAEAARLGTDSLNGSSTNLSAAALLAEHQSRGRDRRVSSVTYASVGHVRHDGSRLRANSDDSEHGGLLEGAAPMGETGGRVRAASAASSVNSGLRRPHLREQSTTSLLSLSTTGSDRGYATPGQQTPPSTRDGAGSRGPSDRREPQTSDSSPTTNRFTPEASTGSEDNGELQDQTRHVSQPPAYEQVTWGEAPAYESPVNERSQARTEELEGRLAQRHPGSSIGELSQRLGVPARVPVGAPRLPALDVLPSISVENATEPNTPASLTGREHAQEGR